MTFEERMILTNVNGKCDIDSDQSMVWVSLDIESIEYWIMPPLFICGPMKPNSSSKLVMCLVSY